MKLAKALKEKNRLVGEVNRLKILIQRENSRDVKSKSKVDVGTLWSELESATNSLIALKTEIFKANSGIYDKIVRMGELKSKADWLNSIPKGEGVSETPYGMQVMTRETVAWMNQEKADSIIVKLQEEIGTLQDEIDEYNATVTIDI